MISTYVVVTFGVMKKKRVKRALIALEFSSPNYHKQVDLYYEYGFRENLAFEILQ